jgi:uncharacterized protein (TIGR03382 family)
MLEAMRTRWLAAAVLIFASSPAAAHIAMTSPAPRGEAQKAGPCGAAGSTRGTNVTTYAPGQTITVEWDETVGHPGHYRIAFDDDGNDVFQNPNNPNDNFPSTLVEPIADVGGTTHYTQTVTLPNITCDNCTLQLIQVMTTAVPYNSFYYQCADIILAGAPTDPTDPTDPTPELDGGCSTTGGTGGSGLVVLGAALALRRRRAR